MPGWSVSHGAPGTQVPTARLAGIVRPIRSQVQQFVDGTSGATRVWLFTLLLAALTLVPRRSSSSRPTCRWPSRSSLPVWLLAAGFYLAEAKVIHLHIGRSAHSFSMSELPLVAGLFLVSPPAFIVARLVGSGAGPLLQPAPALGQARVQPRPVQPRVGRLGRDRPRGGLGRTARSDRRSGSRSCSSPSSRTSSAC